MIDRAINDVATRRGGPGLVSTRTHFKLASTASPSSREQLVSAVSMIRDTDYAQAVTQQSRSKLLQRSSPGDAQANPRPAAGRHVFPFGLNRRVREGEPPASRGSAGASPSRVAALMRDFSRTAICWSWC